jgi:hypothetical protein
MYRWELRKRKILIPFLKELLPYLRAKREQCLVLIDVLENWVNPFNRKLGMSPEELQRREVAWKKMRQLNAVGAAATTKSHDSREAEAIV